MSSTRSKRLLKEFKMVQNEEDFVELVEHTSSDIGKWQVVLKSGIMPDYLGTVTLHINFPKDYPFKPPTVLIPTIFHPNVYVTGRLCISTLDEKSSVHDNNAKETNWRPSLSMVNILVGIKSLLENPNPDSPANVDANRMYLGDRNSYEEKNESLKTIREERLEREKMLREQDQKFEEARIDDASKNIVSSTREEDELNNREEDDLHNREEGELHNMGHPSGDESCGKVSVVQPILTKCGREMFQFMTHSEPSVGDLRQALKRRRPEGGINLSVNLPKKIMLDDMFELKHYSSTVIMVEEI